VLSWREEACLDSGLCDGHEPAPSSVKGPEGLVSLSWEAIEGGSLDVRIGPRRVAHRNGRMDLADDCQEEAYWTVRAKR
jgi:hypothetical protein